MNKKTLMIVSIITVLFLIIGITYIIKSKSNEQKDDKMNLGDFKTMEKIEPKTFDELVEQNAGLVFEKQMNFHEVIKDKNDWEIDIKQEKIVFDDLEFKIQVIGTFSYLNNSWLWSWANEEANLSDDILKSVKNIKKIGSKLKIKQLNEEMIDGYDGFEHKMATISSGLLKSDAYYSAKYDGGTLIVLINDSKINNQKQISPLTLISNFNDLVLGMELNHKNALKNYLIDKDYKINISENSLKAIKGSDLIIAKFNRKGHLTSLKTEKLKLQK